jgi:hypothetical protein
MVTTAAPLPRVRAAARAGAEGDAEQGAEDRDDHGRCQQGDQEAEDLVRSRG